MAETFGDDGIMVTRYCGPANKPPRYPRYQITISADLRVQIINGLTEAEISYLAGVIQKVVGK